MIGFAALMFWAVLFKLLGWQYYTPFTVVLAAGLLALRFGVRESMRAPIEVFLLRFGVLNYALASQDPSYFESAVLVFCIVPSLSRLRNTGRLALAEGTCLLLLAWMVWSCVWTADLGMTVAGIAMSAVGLGFLLAWVLTFEGDLERILQEIIIVLAALAASSVIVGAMGLGAVGVTFAGVTFHRNQLGLLLGLLVLLSLFSSRSPLWARVAGGLGGGGLLLYCDSKSAILSIAAAASLFVILNQKRWWIWGGLAATGVAVFFLSLPSPRIDNLTRVLGRDPTFTGRTGIWEDSLQLLEQQPFTGYGYNAVWSAFENRLAQFPEAPGPQYAHAFNGWIEWGLQLGLGGALLYALFLAVYLHRAHGSVFGVHALCLLAYIEIYNLANVSNIPITRFGFFMLAVVTTCLFLGPRRTTS